MCSRDEVGLWSVVWEPPHKMLPVLCKAANWHQKTTELPSKRIQRLPFATRKTTLLKWKLVSGQNFLDSWRAPSCWRSSRKLLVPVAELCFGWEKGGLQETVLDHYGKILSTSSVYPNRGYKSLLGESSCYQGIWILTGDTSTLIFMLLPLLILDWFSAKSIHFSCFLPIQHYSFLNFGCSEVSIVLDILSSGKILEMFSFRATAMQQGGYRFFKTLTKLDIGL